MAPMFSAFMGGCMGMGIKAYVNNLEGILLRRRPWEYVMSGGFFAWAGYKADEWQQRLTIECNEINDRLGLPRLEGGLSLREAFKNGSYLEREKPQAK